jgi:hypothetical protein
VAFPTGEAEARHSEWWYGSSLRDATRRGGDRVFIRCVGGPCLSRLETFPPRLEIQEKTGLYVLVNEGPLDAWSYQFVPRTGHGTWSQA